jgi:hypothetical protein
LTGSAPPPVARKRKLVAQPERRARFSADCSLLLTRIVHHVLTGELEVLSTEYSVRSAPVRIVTLRTTSGHSVESHRLDPADSSGELCSFSCWVF